MAVYMGSEAYDFSLFEPQIIEQPRISPKTKSPQQKQKNNTAVKVKGMNQTVERKSASVAVNPVAVKIAFFAVVCCICFVVLLVMNSQSNALAKQISSIENKIDIAQGETVRLNAELNSKISNDKIEAYAEDVLGMVKAESYQISYIDLSDGDEVVVSGDKKVSETNDVSGKIKELFAYIF